MNIETNELISDLKLLIEISTKDQKHLVLFEQFHKKLIREAYKAIDISIDYDRQRVNMHVIVEDTKGDYLDRFDQQVPNIMVVNLSYSDLNTFLKTCIVSDISNFKNYYQLLKSEFFNSKRADSTTQPLTEESRVKWAERLSS